MYEELKDRVVVLTGAARGVGQGLAIGFAKVGAIVIAVDILDCGETVKRVQAEGGKCWAFRLDLTDEAAVNAMVEDVIGIHGRVDVLINNAGILNPTPWDELDLDIWNRFMTVNATSQFLTVKACIPHMKKAGFGRIINVSGAIAETPVPNFISYRASKMAVIGMTRSLATEMGQYGITANCVSPSYIVTPGQIELGNDALREGIVAVQAIKRDGLPSDLAGLVVFLASDSAEFITGQMIHADGGLTYK